MSLRSPQTSACMHASSAIGLDGKGPAVKPTRFVTNSNCKRVEVRATEYCRAKAAHIADGDPELLGVFQGPEVHVKPLAVVLKREPARRSRKRNNISCVYEDARGAPFDLEKRPGWKMPSLSAT